MVSLTLNFLAFYLGAVSFERFGIFSGVAVFLLIALSGTIVASGIEKLTVSLAGKAFTLCVDHIARQTAEKPYSGIKIRTRISPGM